MDFVSFVELCAALVTVTIPILAQLSSVLNAHIALDAKIEAIATELETHKADLQAIQTTVTELEGLVKPAIR